MLDADRAALDHYVAEAKRHPLLDRQEELELARRWRTKHDSAAREKLVVSNLRFVLKIAHDYAGYGVSLRELVQEGNVGLLVAVDRFDPERGPRFISYAVWWIRAMILSSIQRSLSLVRTGTTGGSRRAFFKARRVRKELEALHQREVSSAEVAAALAVSEASVDEIEQRLVARDMPFDAGEIERLADAAPTPEEIVADAEAKRIDVARMRQALLHLDDRERTIVKRRHLAEERESLSAIGEGLSVTRERVRQIESRAMQKLRDALAA